MTARSMVMFKVIIASEWQFLEPDDIKFQFNESKIGHNKLIEYDEGNHHFVVDCPVKESRFVAEELQRIVQKYIERQEDEFDQNNELGDMSKIRPIMNTELKTLSINEQIWQQVDVLEAQAKETLRPAQLIPQITAYLNGRFAARDMEVAFSKMSLSEVAKATNTTVDLELTNLYNRIRVVGWSEHDVHAALQLLDGLEAQYEGNMQKVTYDFYDDEGHVKPGEKLQMRFQKPLSVIDIQLFGPGLPPICELTRTEWIGLSRQHATVRKNAVPIDHAGRQEMLWVKPLVFPWTDAVNNPTNWLREEDDATHFVELSLPAIGRTEQWLELQGQGPARQDDTMSVATRKTTRATKPIKATAPGKEQVRPNRFDENIKEEEEDEYSDIEPLQAPIGRVTVLDHPVQGTFINHAIKSTLTNAQGMHNRALSLEMRLGRIYIHTVSLRNKKHQPRRGGQAQEWIADKEWPKIFRIRDETLGASTCFSPKLTQTALDAEFILNMKMKGGEKLFEATPRDRRAFFEVVCYDTRISTEAVIEIMDRKVIPTLEGSDETAGTVNIHYPARNWDCSWQLQTRRQSFPPEQNEVFQVVNRHIYVSHDPAGNRDPELYSRRHPRVSIRSVHLIRETVHRAKGGLALILRQVKHLSIQHMQDERFKAGVLDDELMAEGHHVWWEAKLVSAGIQQQLGENRALDIGHKATWQPDHIMPQVKNMVELAQHVISKIDNVGAMFMPSKPDSSQMEQTAEQQSQTQVTRPGIVG